ncbi:MAG: hypothetical protein ACLP1X_28435, partial [Polyangiaceae bacterium]
ADASTGLPPSVASDVSAGPVTGMVVDFATNRPLANRLVQIGSARATTDTNGAFTIPNAPSTYDVAVLEPDGTSVSIYSQLSRREPLLSHESHAISAVANSGNTATVTGTVSGGATFPLVPPNAVAVYYFSSEAETSLLLGGTVATPLAGPQYGPMHLFWNGAPSISGELIAMGTFSDVSDASTWFASEQLSLATGEDAQAPLTLTPTATVSIRGNIIVPNTVAVYEKEVLYRLPFVDSTMSLLFDETDDASFNYNLPDLDSLGGQYCLSVQADLGFAGAQLCGIAEGSTDVSVSIMAPSSLQEPTGAAVSLADAGFSWTPVNSAIYMLQFKQSIATSGTPNIDIFTSSTTARWPDLESLGVSVTAGTTYQCSIGALGPYSSMDDAFGPMGQGQAFPSVVQVSYSQPRDITLSP